MQIASVRDSTCKEDSGCQHGHCQEPNLNTLFHIPSVATVRTLGKQGKGAESKDSWISIIEDPIWKKMGVIDDEYPAISTFSSSFWL